jgi:hypothetical protein
MVANDHAGMPVLGNEMSNVWVGWFQRPPAAPGELKASRPYIAAGWHAGIRAQIGVIKDHAFARQRVEIGSLDPGVAVTTKMVMAQGIYENKDGIHAFSFPFEFS